MKKEELMIGDWVTITEPDDFHGYVGKVVIVNNETGYVTIHIPNMHLHDVFVEDLQPIPLTPEILEKNGFKYYNVGHHYGWSIMDKDYSPALPFSLSKWLLKNDDEFIWGPEEDDNESTYVHEMGRIKYVHELQHLLKVCKIEKEIVL